MEKEHSPKNVNAVTLPDTITRRLGAARDRVRQALGVEPDLTSDTLPLLDGYLRMSAQDLPLADRKSAIEELGVHFGEVVRRELHGHWVATDDAPLSTWRIELESCFLYFHPIGMTGEVTIGCESEAHDGSFATSNDLQEGLTEMLAHAEPLGDLAYYSLSGRHDVLSLVADFLTSQRVVASKGKALKPYSAADYAREIAAHSAN
ncbi:MAG: hypothetical protein KAI47_10805 [Deltaproteobacteria bacterium]|nr:hypothetical protein [Deltaproteobacteria bacterium]